MGTCPCALAGVLWSLTVLVRPRILSLLILSWVYALVRSRLARLAAASASRSTTSCFELRKSLALGPSMLAPTSAARSEAECSLMHEPTTVLMVAAAVYCHRLFSFSFFLQRRQRWPLRLQRYCGHNAKL